MKRIKKSLQCFIAFIILLNSAYIPSFALDDESITISEYTDSLSSMVQKYSYSVSSVNSGSAELPANRLIVKTSDNSSLENDCGAVAKIEGYDCLHIMQYSSESETESAYEYYSSLSSVEYVEKDFFFEGEEPATEVIEEKTNNTYMSWGSETVNTDAAISAVNTLGSLAPEIVVAVIDSGLDSTHSFFEGRIADGGHNFVEINDNTSDKTGHGTHVAGIIVDNTPKNVKVRPYKVFQYDSIAYAVVCAAIDEAVDDGVDVINLSLGGLCFEDVHEYYDDSIAKAMEKNISVVVSAGNENREATEYCPANNENVITVSAIDIYLKPWEKTNYGRCVDIAAPGDLINSTTLNGLYMSDSGTSMAAPFVSAAAAIMKSLNQSLSPQVIKDTIKNTAAVPDGWNTKYGVGILDMEGMLSALRLPTPQMSFDGNQNVVMKSGVSGATIYYTTDGSNPVVGKSAVYTGPIDPGNAENIRAIACKDGALPSKIINLKIRWSEDITVRYMGTAELPISSGAAVESAYSSHEEIVSYSDKKVKGLAIGEAEVTVNLASGQRVTYNVTVEFASWQWFHAIVYKLFGILIWSF